MDRLNKFEQLFNSITESREAYESIRSKLSEGVLEVNKARKIYITKEKVLAEGKSEVASLKTSNRKLKTSMVLAMIERDELESKKRDLQQKIQKMKLDIDGLDKQSDYILRSVEPSQPRDKKNQLTQG